MFAKSSIRLVCSPRIGGCRSRNSAARGFSLVELVIVVVIIGVIASIAVPRLSRASTAAKANALDATIASVRKAIDVYYAEHGKYPGYAPGTTTPSDAAFARQLLQYTSEDGTANASKSATFEYGPYLRGPFPSNPINRLKTVKVKANPAEADPGDGTVGWVAVLSHGYFGVSASDADLADIGIEAKLLEKVKGGAINID